MVLRKESVHSAVPSHYTLALTASDNTATTGTVVAPAMSPPSTALYAPTYCYSHSCVPLLPLRNINTTITTAFNSEVEDILCYSGTGTLCIKTGSDFPLHQQKLSGDIVGFSASKVRATPLLQPLEH
jgi:hypothetical protein